MGRKVLNAAVVVFCIVAVSQSAGSKIDGGFAHKANVSNTGKDLDGLAMLTQLRAAVTQRVSASIHHAATPELLSSMMAVALNVARLWKPAVVNALPQPPTATQSSASGSTFSIVGVEDGGPFTISIPGPGQPGPWEVPLPGPEPLKPSDQLTGKGDHIQSPASSGASSAKPGEESESKGDHIQSPSSSQASSAKPGEEPESEYANITESMKATINKILDVRVDLDFMNLKQRMAASENLFKTCENSREEGLRDNLELQERFPDLVKKHSRCREQEALNYADKKACDESMQSDAQLRSANCDLFIDYGHDESTSLCSPQLSETAEEYNRRMISDFSSRLEAVRSQKILCQNESLAVKSQRRVCTEEDSQLQEQRKSCNAIQETLDAKACQLGSKMSSNCQAYRACRQQTEDSWHLAAKSVEWSVENLKKEFVTLRKVECLLNHLGADEAQLLHCLDAFYDSSHLSLSIPKPPESHACEALAEEPGTPSYQRAVYGVLPTEAPAAPCVALCCTTT